MWNKIKLFILIMKGGVDMVAVYVSLMIAGRRTFAQVPPILQEDVKKDLTAIGLGELAE